MIDWLAERPQCTVAVAWLALAAAVCALAIPRMLDLGLYYDEAFMAQQARGFVEPERAGSHPGSVREILVAGRPFPVRNAAYLGSLKSQLLIPPFALFGADPFVLRAATLGVGLLSLWLTMAWAASVLGTTTALLAGLLIASDPSFYFFSQFEWGPFTTNFLCRAAGLLLLTHGFRAKRTAALVAGGLALGLGVYSRADFAIVVAAMTLGALAADRGSVGRVLGERRGALAATALAFAIGAAPTLVLLPEILRTGGDIAARGDLATKLGVLRGVVDGSHFGRLMDVGGRFEEMATVPGAATPGVAVLAATALASLVAAARGALRGRTGLAFIAWTAVFVTCAMPLVPGAVRAHHMLNTMPFLQLWIAGVIALGAGGRLGAPARIGRGIAGALVVVLIGANLRVVLEARAEISRTGGRGRFSSALTEIATLGDREGSTFVSLDWGFHEPVLFVTDRASAIEPIWTIPRLLRAGRAWSHRGDTATTYLVHAAPYDLFGIGPELLRAAARLGPDRAIVTWHGGDDPAFATVRFAPPHQLVYDGTFRVRFEPPTD